MTTYTVHSGRPTLRAQRAKLKSCKDDMIIAKRGTSAASVGVPEAAPSAVHVGFLGAQ